VICEKFVRFYLPVEALAKSGARLTLECHGYQIQVEWNGDFRVREVPPAIVEAGRETGRRLRISLLIGLIVTSSMYKGRTCRTPPPLLVANLPQ
jgi:hypothetical protein